MKKTWKDGSCTWTLTPHANHNLIKVVAVIEFKIVSRMNGLPSMSLARFQIR
nr:hypothetical protein [Enterococcus faecium]